MKTLKLALIATLLATSPVFAAALDLAGFESDEVTFPAGVICVPSDQVVVYNWGKLQPAQYLLLQINHGQKGLINTLFSLQKGYCAIGGFSLTKVTWERSNAVPAPTQPGQKILNFSLTLEFSSPRNEAPNDLVLNQTVLVNGAIYAGKSDPWEAKIFSFTVR